MKQKQSIDWFLYDNGLRHERVKGNLLDVNRKFRSIQKGLNLPLEIYPRPLKEQPRL